MKSLNSKEEILQKALEALRKSFDIKASTKKEIGQETANENKFSAQQADAVLNRKFHSKLRGIKPVRNDSNEFFTRR